MAEQKLKWGVISTANIGWDKVIPGVQLSENNKIVAIGSENVAKAEKIAADNGIDRVHESYEELINDPDIDIVYNPLPNNLHVEWSIKALQAGKHVLCEKPLAMTAGETQRLLDEAKKHPKLKLMEAFMYKFHPQWLKVRALLDKGSIGEVRTVNTFFSYFNTDPNNIRNRVEVGGGALMDIGCYCISFPRFLLGEEPINVQSTIELDPVMKTDKMTSAILEFSEGKTATFTCSTQLAPYQRCIVYGKEGHIEIEIPCNAPIDKPCKMWLRANGKEELIEIVVSNQYTYQADALAKFIREDADMTYYLDDMLGNMKVIDAVVKSSREGKRVDV
jgi:predicted dehydrogenase